MNDYKIIINVSDVGGVYSARDIDEANKIAQSECDDIYARLRGRCNVEIKSVELIHEGF